MPPFLRALSPGREAEGSSEQTAALYTAPQSFTRYSGQASPLIGEQRPPILSETRSVTS